VRLRTRSRLFLSYLLLVAGVVLALMLGVDVTLRGPLVEQAAAELQREVRLAAEVYDARGGAPDSLARALSALSGHRVTVVAPDGTVVGDSHVAPAHLASLENHGARPEVMAAFARGSGTAVRRSASVGAELVYAAARTSRGPVIRFAMGIEAAEAAVARVRRQIAAVGGMALLLAAALSLALSHAVTRPLHHMQSVAGAMAAGDLTSRVRSGRGDELGDLGTALDRLADELERRLGQLTREREEMQALIDSMAEGVVALGPDGTVSRTNPAAREIFGLEGDARGLPPEAVARRPAFLALVQRVRAGETVGPTELAYHGRTLLATAHPLRGAGAVLVFLDISQLRRLETARRQFVANASHELKTPLTAIRGFSETLLDDDVPDELRRQFTATLHANAERLQRLVDDLLDLSRIESGSWEVRPEEVGLEGAVQAAWRSLAYTQQEAPTLDVSIGEGADRVRADASALQQILTNLLSNAVRYSPGGGRISVRTHRIESPPPADGGWIRIEVSDMGAGIPSAHLPHIFERFYRVDASRSRAEGGTGLGLAIVKHLVESHGGQVAAESELGVGTTISFMLRAAE
jgi:two-component system, OmpR family, phosphate regulon sensor histidine kinase PhoR